MFNKELRQDRRMIAEYVYGLGIKNVPPILRHEYHIIQYILECLMIRGIRATYITPPPCAVQDAVCMEFVWQVKLTFAADIRTKPK